jgi:hypothetical protein
MNLTDEGDVDRIIDDERQVSLQGCDGGEPVIVSSRIAFFSPLIKDALQESDQDTMELARVPGRVLRKVVEFMEHYVIVEPMHDISEMVLATKTFEQVRILVAHRRQCDRRIPILSLVANAALFSTIIIVGSYRVVPRFHHRHGPTTFVRCAARRQLHDGVPIDGPDLRLCYVSIDGENRKRGK